MLQTQALIFDVFGTLVDWHGSIRRELQTTLVDGLGLPLDAAALATAWRAQYQPAMQEIRSGQRPFCDLDVLHRRNLDVVLNDAGVSPAVDDATLAPAQVMMVACHSSDLAAAAAAGLQSGFIARPHEGGPGVGETQAACAVQAQAGNLLQLAQGLLAV
ncbi:MAG: hypothetical protein C4K60_15295 [Ideonella sp. MAG2]|nr:MAG: hypothetical protein C4K60_15295 [Ideonella sp. MAG2]